MSITKKQIHNIVSEELKILLRESQTQDEGILDMFKKDKSKERSADDLAAMDALRGMPAKSRMDARDVSVTGYKDLASKEQGKPMMKKARSYSLEEEPDDFERFADTPGYEDERVPSKTAHQRKRADMPAEEPKYDDSHLRALGYLEELQNEDVRALRRTYQEYAHWLRSRPNDANKPTIDSLSLYLISTQPKSKTTMKYNPSFGNGDLADEIANSGQLKSAAEALEVDAKALYAKVREDERKLASRQRHGLPVSKESLFEEGGEEKTYPSPSKMKKLVAQALRSKKDVGRNPAYDPNETQLRKDYDKHVRNTLRDPKHSQAHKRE
tara:strand:+ start:2253 stop:3230 length:978 start_codon:yes stop_codon:yes gene_type:complete